MTDEEVKTAIKDIIATACPAAVIWPYNVLSHQLAEWPALFRKADSTVEGWMIMRTRIDAHWKNTSREKATWHYTILGFYGFRTGKEGDNSDDEFAVKLDAIRAGFKAAPTLEIECVEKHDLLQVAANTTIDCGEETLHLANCSLAVHVCD